MQIQELKSKLGRLFLLSAMVIGLMTTAAEAMQQDGSLFINAALVEYDSANYGQAVAFEMDYRVLGKAGLGYSISLGYLKENNMTDIPLGFTVLYAVIPNARITPFLGAGLKAHWIDDSGYGYASPGFAYHITAGIETRVTPHSRLLASITQEYYTDSDTDATLDSLSYKLGIGFDLKPPAPQPRKVAPPRPARRAVPPAPRRPRPRY